MVEKDRRAEDSGHRGLTHGAGDAFPLPTPAPTRWGAVWALFGAGLVCGAYLTKVAPALPLQREELGVSLVESGLIATAFNISGSLLGIFAGGLSGRLGLRATALAGLALLALAGALGATTASFPVLLGSRFLEGVGSLMFTVSGSALIAAAATNPRDRAKALGLWAANLPAGGGMGLLLAPPIIAAWGWRGLWWALALAAGLGFLLAARLAPASARSGKSSLRMIAETLARPGNLVLAALFACYASQWVSVMIWLPTFLVDERGMTAGRAALLTAFMVLANAPGNIAGGWLLSRHVRRGPLVIAACALMAACAAGMFGPWLPDGLRYLLCLAFSLCGGVIPAAIFAGLPGYARSSGHLGTANGLVVQSAQAGQFVGPLALAWLASHFGGWGATLWAILGFALGGALCGLALLRIERTAAR
ncbi:MAG: MFS transporter [Burkholderiales bacterium]|nr:MFS transporter [Burkholderiales bacterium]